MFVCKNEFGVNRGVARWTDLLYVQTLVQTFAAERVATRRRRAILYELETHRAGELLNNWLGLEQYQSDIIKRRLG